MDDSSYKKMLSQAQADYLTLQKQLGDCLKEQDRLEKRIVGVRETIVSLSKLLGEEFVDEDALGLTDAIRQAFKTYGSAMTPTDVKERLEQIGYDTAKYGNVMASVHSIINRLVVRGEIRSTATIGGKPAYEWVPKQIVIKRGMLASEFAKVDKSKLPDDVRAVIGHPKKK